MIGSHSLSAVSDSVLGDKVIGAGSQGLQLLEELVDVVQSQFPHPEPDLIEHGRCSLNQGAA